MLEKRFRRDLKRHKDLEQALKVEVQKGSGQVEEVMSMFGSEQQAQAVAEATYIAAAAGVVGIAVGLVQVVLVQMVETTNSYFGPVAEAATWVPLDSYSQIHRLNLKAGVNVYVNVGEVEDGASQREEAVRKKQRPKDVFGFLLERRGSLVRRSGWTDMF